MVCLSVEFDQSSHIFKGNFWFFIVGEKNNILPLFVRIVGEEEEQHWCNFFKNLRANKNRDRTNQRMGRKGHRGRQGHGGGPSVSVAVFLLQKPVVSRGVDVDKPTVSSTHSSTAASAVFGCVCNCSIVQKLSSRVSNAGAEHIAGRITLGKTYASFWRSSGAGAFQQLRLPGVNEHETSFHRVLLGEGACVSCRDAFIGSLALITR